MDKATNAQIYTIKKHRPDLYRDDLTKQDAYKIVEEIKKTNPSQPKSSVNDAILGMCFKLSKKHSTDPISLYNEYFEIKAKLESK